MSVQDHVMVEKWQVLTEFEEGHYKLPILSKGLQPWFPENKEMAEKWLASLSQKLERNPDL